MNREKRALELYNKLLKKEKVTRWEVFPVRNLLLDLARENKDLTSEIEFLIDEAKASL